MKKLIFLILFCIAACSGEEVEISEGMIFNARSACSCCGDIKRIKIKIDSSTTWGKIKFVCSNELETPWWGEKSEESKLPEDPNGQ